MARIIEKGIRTRVRKEDRTSFYWQFFLGFLSLLVLGAVIALIWYATRLNMFTITEISVSGGETISHDEIRGQIEQELTGAYFLIVPKHFIYLYPHNRIVEVLEKNERLYNIYLERTSRNAIAVTFSEYVPHALSCAQNAPEECLFITENGYAFTKAPELNGGALVRHYMEARDEIEKGTIIDANVLARIDAFVMHIEEEFGFRTASLLHKKNGDIEISLHGGGMVFLSLGNDMDTAFENLKVILASPEFRDIQPGNFNYIDLRFGNKAYVNEEMSVATSTQSLSTTTLPE
ncbi:MAG: hypothetical protein NUW00_03285 [Candidatus Kaiserbacteria bacterium]|nr:hypothetical protein [Candidatus Kaiserbacteria bacterium]